MDNKLESEAGHIEKGRKDGGGIFLGGILKRYGKEGYIARDKDGGPKFEASSNPKLYFTNSQYVEYAYQLAQKIRENGVPKAIVAPLRGGWVGFIVAQELGIPFYPMYSSTRDDQKQVKPKAEQYFGYPIIPVEIDDIMLVDDMVDEGVTGKEIADYFQALSDVKIFRSAVFFQKQKERSYTADIVLHDIADVWVNQPFEAQYESQEGHNEVIQYCREILNDLHRSEVERKMATELLMVYRISSQNLMGEVGSRVKNTIEPTDLSRHISKGVVRAVDYTMDYGNKQGYKDMIQDAMSLVESFSQDHAEYLRNSGGIIYKYSDFQGMMVAIALSRRYQIPIGTLLPDGRVICSTIKPIGLDKSLFVESGIPYELSTITDNVSPHVQSICDYIKRTISDSVGIAEIVFHPEDSFSTRIAVQVRSLLPRLQLSIPFSVAQPKGTNPRFKKEAPPTEQDSRYGESIDVPNLKHAHIMPGASAFIVDNTLHIEITQFS